MSGPFRNHIVQVVVLQDDKLAAEMYPNRSQSIRPLDDDDDDKNSIWVKFVRPPRKCLYFVGNGDVLNYYYARLTCGMHPANT